MSGGEQQRSLEPSRTPPCCSPTSPPPTSTRRGRDLARLLRQLADEDDRSIVIVSHDDRLRQVADRVLWLEDGRFKTVATLVVEVCRMPVEPVGPHAEWEARTL